MIQVIALYQPTGAPWYYVPLKTLLFLIALSLPFVVRFVMLRRPVINLWAAIPLSFLFGFIIYLFFYNLFPTKYHPTFLLLLVGVACFYSYWIMHIGYRSYCLQRFINNNTEDEQEDEQEISSRRKGIRRIVFILAALNASICVGLVAAEVRSIHNEAQSNLQRKQQKYKEQYLPIETLPGGFISEGTLSKLKAAGFSDKEIQIYADNETAKLKTEQILAKRELLQEQKGFWVNLSLPVLVALSGGIGLVAGTFGFLTVWLIYGFLEWVVLGFCDNDRLKLTLRRLTALFPSIVVKRVFNNFLAMNKKHIVIWIGIAVVVLMCIFPPWIRVIEIESSRAYRPIGYHFLLAPPKSEGVESYSIDFGLLILQCIIISLITVGLLCTLRTEHSKRKYLN